MAGKNIVVFMGSVRPNRMVERVAKFVKTQIEATGMKAIMFDPQEMMFEVLQLPLHFMPNPSEAPGWLKDANDKIKGADGFVIITGEYNCSFPPALTNMMDHFPPTSYRHRPCGVISYSVSTFGGIRALTQTHHYANELGMFTLPTKVPIPTVQDAFKEDGTCMEDRVAKNISMLVKEIDWYSNAINNEKKNAPPPS
jgi:NAD(P)H-dependent FMN reductase